jgi:hypothetical protein
MTREELVQAVLAAEAAFAAAESEARDAQDEITSSPGDPAAAARLRRALRRLAQTRLVLRRAQEALAAFDAAPPLPDDSPVVLLPVRLETRFVTDASGRALLVRVYPDEVHVEAHWPELTVGEVAAGSAYASLVAQAGSDVEAQRRAFEQLASRVGATRALYIASLASSGLPGAVDVVRTVHTRAMPSRWHVYGFRGGARVVSAVGSPISASLALGPAADAPPPAAGGLPLDEASRWLINFPSALANGMALRVPMPDDGGLDRLVVLGVRDGAASESADLLAGLLSGHRFAAGLDVLPPGTPTNNTTEERSGWTRRPDARELFDAMSRSVSTPSSTPDTDAASSALGVPVEILSQSVHAGTSSPAHARAMHRALWPATLGYVLETLGGASVSDSVIEASRRLFIDSVRGLGPLPTLQIGTQPYGLLPATSFHAWRPAQPGAIDDIVALLRRLAPEWLAAAGRVPHVGRAGADPDQELLNILGREALTGGYRLRPVRGRLLSAAMALLIADLDPVGERLADAAYRLAGGTATAPPLAMMAFDPRTERIRRPTVLAGPLSETEPLPGPEGGGPNYLRYLASRSDRSGSFSGPGSTSLLRAVAQRSANLADLDAAVRFSAPANVAQAKAALEPEVVDPVPQQPSSTPARVLARPIREVIPAAPAGTSISEFIATATPAQVTALGLPHVRDAFIRATDVRQALSELSTVPSAALDRLTRAAFDTCSHRLDAWLTALATQRLTEVRQTHPTGAYIGGYGFVENLSPKPPKQPVTSLPPGESGPLVTDPLNAGLVAAPSLGQASTAALLLSGHLSHRFSEAPDAFAVDLSSDRARVALWLLDGVRQGQPLGALLGYRFERGLHDRSHPGLELDRFIRPLRSLAPIVAEAAESSQAVEALAASGVVDGLELLRRWKQDGPVVEAKLANATPPATEPERAAVRLVLQALADDADAVADLLLAESVHQVASGNLTRAAAMSDAVGSGLGPPPDPEVLDTPRMARAFPSRLVLLAPLSTEPADGWAAQRPRRLAEPRLERWVASLLPPPASIRAVARVASALGSVSPREFALTETGVCALDVVHGSELELLLVEAMTAALADASGAPQVSLLHRGDADWPGATWPSSVMPLEDALEQGRWIAESTGSSRPLATADLSPAGAALDPDLAELRQRAQVAETSFRAAAASLTAASDVASVRSALLDLSGFGIRGIGAALRDARAPAADAAAVLAVGAAAALAETARILAVLDGSPGPAEALHAIFGNDFAVLPLCTPPAGWSASVSASSTPSFVDGDLGAPVATLQRVALVRSPVERYLLATAGAGGPFTPVQVPAASRWVGLPLPVGATWADLPDQALTVMVHGTATEMSAVSLAGLVVDEWTDRVPSPTGTAGVAFHFDEPGARAPQAILVAVPPVLGEAWTQDALLEVVTATADLAQIRMVGPEDVSWLGRFLPALLVPENTAGDTFTVDLMSLVQQEG